MAQGIIVIDQWAKLGHQRCKHWLFRVWDARKRRWKSKAFDAKADGWRWAEETRSQLNLGLMTTGSLSLTAVSEDYEQSLGDRQIGAFHRGEIKRVCAAIGKAADNMLSKEFAKDVGRWLATATTFAKGRAAPLSNVTKNRWLRHVRSVCIHAVHKRWLPLNPLHGLKPLKENKTLPVTLSIDELRAAAADDCRSDPYFLAACLMVYAGLRGGEALFAKWEWVDFSARTITLRTTPEYPIKGNKERVVPLLDELRDVLLDWPSRAAKGYIVADPSYRQLENKGRWKAFRSYLKRCGLAPRDLHPHATRHTWASIMVATGKSLSWVKDALGHSSIKTTAGYTTAEVAFENVVRGWTRGQMFLRRAAPADAIEDPLLFLREHLQAGRTIEQLASASAVPVAVLAAWAHQGAPEVVRQLQAATAAAARLAAADRRSALPSRERAASSTPELAAAALRNLQPDPAATVALAI